MVSYPIKGALVDLAILSKRSANDRLDIWRVGGLTEGHKPLHVQWHWHGDVHGLIEPALLRPGMLFEAVLWRAYTRKNRVILSDPPARCYCLVVEVTADAVLCREAASITQFSVKEGQWCHVSAPADRPSKVAPECPSPRSARSAKGSSRSSGSNSASKPRRGKT